MHKIKKLKHLINQLVKEIGSVLQKKQWKIVTVESCTGGGIAKALTDCSGSSSWCEGGFVTYSNEMKILFTKVDKHLITKYGAISSQVAEAMAKGALLTTNANISVAASGIAGPTGGTLKNPIGTVWLGWGLSDGRCFSHSFLFQGDRTMIREKAIYYGLKGVYDLACFDRLHLNKH